MPFTEGARQTLERSLQICLSEGHRSIQTSRVLAGLAVAGPRDPAMRLLHRLGVDPGELGTAIRHHWAA